jgi:hypothetical protein
MRDRRDNSNMYLEQPDIMRTFLSHGCLSELHAAFAVKDG